MQDRRRMLGRALTLALIVLSLPGAASAQDAVTFRGLTADNAPTDFILVGESEILVHVVFPEDCLGFEIAISDPLFVEPLYGFTYTNRTKGEGYSHSLRVNSSAEPGNHSVECTFSYLNLSNERVNLTVSLPLRVIQPIVLLGTSIPEGLDRNFTLRVRVNMEVTSLEVLFDSDGDIGLTNETLSMSGPGPGEYTFSTVLVRDEGGRGPQELGYHVRASVFNRSVEVYRYNIPVGIRWDEDTGNPSDGVWERLWASLALRILVIMVILLLLAYLYRRRSRQTQD